MVTEHQRQRLEAIERKKARRLVQASLEESIRKRKESRWVDHPEGVTSDGMGGYYLNGERLIPPGEVVGHCIEGWLIHD